MAIKNTTLVTDIENSCGGFEILAAWSATEHRV
jgi:hypothetical protein